MRRGLLSAVLGLGPFIGRQGARLEAGAQLWLLLGRDL